MNTSDERNDFVEICQDNNAQNVDERLRRLERKIERVIRDNHTRQRSARLHQPIVSQRSAQALGPPSDQEVLRTLAKCSSKERKGRQLTGPLRIVTQKIADYVDPPRFMPLIEPAQLHHMHYKCTIYRGTDKADGKVVYIDRSYVRLIASDD